MWNDLPCLIVSVQHCGPQSNPCFVLGSAAASAKVVAVVPMLPAAHPSVCSIPVTWREACGVKCLTSVPVGLHVLAAGLVGGDHYWGTSLSATFRAGKLSFCILCFLAGSSFLLLHVRFLQEHSSGRHLQDPQANSLLLQEDLAIKPLYFQSRR